MKKVTRIYKTVLAVLSSADTSTYAYANPFSTSSMCTCHSCTIMCM